MKTLFDHLFFRVYWWNYYIVKQGDLSLFSTLIGISIFKVLNISVIIFSIYIYLIKNIHSYPKLVHIIIMIFILIIDYLVYFYKGRYKLILNAAKHIENSELKRRDIIVVGYIILTFFTFAWIISQGITIHNGL